MAAGGNAPELEVTLYLIKDGGRPCLRQSSDVIHMADDIISADSMASNLSVIYDM